MACGTPSLLDSTDVFLEAQDCFSAPLPKMEDRNVLDMAVGAKLGLTKERIEFFFRSYKPKGPAKTWRLIYHQPALKFVLDSVRKRETVANFHRSGDQLPQSGMTGGQQVRV